MYAAHLERGSLLGAAHVSSGAVREHREPCVAVESPASSRMPPQPSPARFLRHRDHLERHCHRSPRRRDASRAPEPRPRSRADGDLALGPRSGSGSLAARVARGLGRARDREARPSGPSDRTVVPARRPPPPRSRPPVVPPASRALSAPEHSAEHGTSIAPSMAVSTRVGLVLHRQHRGFSNRFRRGRARHSALGAGQSGRGCRERERRSTVPEIAPANCSPRHAHTARSPTTIFSAA